METRAENKMLKKSHSEHSISFSAAKLNSTSTDIPIMSRCSGYSALDPSPRLNYPFSGWVKTEEWWRCLLTRKIGRSLVVECCCAATWHSLYLPVTPLYNPSLFPYAMLQLGRRTTTSWSRSGRRVIINTSSSSSSIMAIQKRGNAMLQIQSWRQDTIEREHTRSGNSGGCVKDVTEESSIDNSMGNGILRNLL